MYTILVIWINIVGITTMQSNLHWQTLTQPICTNRLQILGSSSN